MCGAEVCRGLEKRGAYMGPGNGSDQGLPLPAAGVHRQVLFTTVGWFVGYYLAKRTEYMHAKLDRELLEYVKQHPEDFKAAGRISWCLKGSSQLALMCPCGKMVLGCLWNLVLSSKLD